jgi:hypothetical protein
MKTLVLDTSGWVFATKLGLTKQLQEQFRLIVPPEVVRETEQGVQEGYRDAFIRAELLKTNAVKVILPPQPLINKVEQMTGLKKRGDVEVVALGAYERAIVYSDDVHLETACMLMEIPLVSTVAMLLKFVKNDLLDGRRCLVPLEILEKLGYSAQKIQEAKAMLESEGYV